MKNKNELIEFVKSIEPFDEIEIRDKEAFLQFLNSFSEEMLVSRDNLVGHLCGSAFVVNKERTKVLFAHHNINNSWSWLGGHADGSFDLYNLAEKEAEEESGIKNLRYLSVAKISSGFVNNHIKNGLIIPGHLHYDIAFAFEADEDDEIRFQEGENTDVAWIDFKDIDKLENVSAYNKHVYKKIIERIKKERK